MKIKLHEDREFCLFCSLLYIQFLNVDGKKFVVQITVRTVVPYPNLGLPMSLSLPYFFFIAVTQNTTNLHLLYTLERKFHE